MNSVKVVRLRDGEDIVCNLEIVEGEHYVLSEPMVFQMMHKNGTYHIAMTHYLPVQLIKSNEVILTERDILFVSEPTDSFAEYYLSSIEKLKEMMKMRNALDDETMDESLMNKILMEAFEDMEPGELTKH